MTASEIFSANRGPLAVTGGISALMTGGAYFGFKNSKDQREEDLGQVGNLKAGMGNEIAGMITFPIAGFLAYRGIQWGAKGIEKTYTYGNKLLDAAYKKFPTKRSAALSAGGEQVTVGREMWDKTKTAWSGGTASKLRLLGSHPIMFAGAGAAIGAAVDKDDRSQGAMIGGGAGLALSVGLHSAGMWNSSRMFRTTKDFKGFSEAKLFKGYAKAALPAALAIGILGILGSHHDTAGEAYAVSDNLGGYDYAAEPGVKRRLRNMNASGNVTLGLHNGRHG